MCLFFCLIVGEGKRGSYKVGGQVNYSNVTGGGGGGGGGEGGGGVVSG